MRRLAMLAVVAVLALTGAACGGDDDSGNDDPDATDDGATTDDGGDDGATDGAVASGLLDDDCQFLLAGAFLNPMAAAVPGGDADVEAASEQLESIAAEAPDEIQDAMEVIADGYAAMAEVLADVDLSDPQSFSDPELQERLAELEDTFDEEYQQAGDTVSAYIADECSG